MGRAAQGGERYLEPGSMPSLDQLVQESHACVAERVDSMHVDDNVIKRVELFQFGDVVDGFV